MHSTVKFGLFVAFAGAAFWLVKTFQQSVNDFGIKLNYIGLPKVNGSLVTVPLNLQLENTTNIPITINDFVADLYVKDKNGNWKPGGFVQQPISIPAGVSSIEIRPVLDLKKLFGGNVFDTLNNILANLKTRTLTIKGEGRGTANGIRLEAVNLIPEQTIQL